VPIVRSARQVAWYSTSRTGQAADDDEEEEEEAGLTWFLAEAKELNWAAERGKATPGRLSLRGLVI
jgi:hypothetical protein